MPSKEEIIEQRKANLPLPEEPPVPSDWNSADERTVNVGTGGREEDLSHSGLGSSTLREPSTTDEVGTTGRQAHDHLPGLPDDAVAREAKHKPGLAHTTNPDYGYPHKNDPSSAGKNKH
ncbi:hypothetical protein DM02DRAFT_597157 [Periconia macrospinosa]|uniref:Uncharacterized protein n=1 Tax=Periconia macrospinosa TaxID=97972 RepID=A0A2V1DI01_9PLEO|nr:hypothetical protein DM02DRAFT_597157 [Periconia macrospinosa]